MMHLSGFFIEKTNKKQGKSEQKRMIIHFFLAIHSKSPYASIFFNSS